MTDAIDRVLVVVPARDEQATVGACLDSVLAAAAALAGERPAVRVDVCVVADACTDDTAALARGRGVTVLEIDAETVGRARAAGVSRLLTGSAPGAAAEEPSGIWIATTDADSVVPPRWLLEQLVDADAGADVVVGTVTPDLGELPVRARARWLATHVRGIANGHVHGANLGLRGSAYLAAGGFAPLATAEDVDLVARIREAGGTVVASARADVLTSARLEGRAPDGYASYLASLA